MAGVGRAADAQWHASPAGSTLAGPAPRTQAAGRPRAPDADSDVCPRAIYRGSDEVTAIGQVPTAIYNNDRASTSTTRLPRGIFCSAACAIIARSNAFSLERLPDLSTKDRKSVE